jgi:hypothetical protein
MEEEFRQIAAQIMAEHNNKPLSDFEGYSPIEMRYVLYNPFDENSPIRFHKLTDADYEKIPILKQVKYLADLISDKNEIKLTAKGFLPTKIVSDIYSQGFIKDELIERGIYKVYKETDAMNINLTRILLELSGLTKKRQGKLSLTKRALKVLSDDFELLKLIFETFATKFNWAYYDGYGENHIGQFGFGFSLILLSNYGYEKRLDEFYSDRYFKALPDLLDKDRPDLCYSLRTFDRFLDYFGLIDIENEGSVLNKKKYVSKTLLFDKFIECTPQNSGE